MCRNAVFFFLCLASLSFAEDEGDHLEIEEKKEKTIFVSLGSTCGPAGLIRRFELRDAAFPFDWVLSVDGEKLIQILDERFEKYLDERYLVPDNFLLEIASGHGLYHIEYRLEFLHDGNWYLYDEAMAKMKEKYSRRIERFKALGEHKGKVVFLRTSWEEGNRHPGIYFKCEENNEISDDYAIRLHAALKRFFPELQFDLVVINFFDEEHLRSRKVREGVTEVKLPLPEFLEEFRLFLLSLK